MAYPWDVEIRAEAISSTIYGKTYTDSIAEAIERNFYIGIDFSNIDIENLRFNCFIAQKYGADDTYELLNNYLKLVDPNLDSAMQAFESEWTMQKLLMGGK